MLIAMFRIRFLGLLAMLFPVIVLAQTDQTPLAGRVEGNTYIAPGGAYRITIPVLEALGGSISDSVNVALFRDQYSVHISIGCFAQDATQRWELSTRGLKDYLEYFFTTYVMPDFRQMYRGATIESMDFAHKVFDGGLLVYTLLPEGSMFAHRLAAPMPDSPPIVAKRGNLLFVRYGHVYVISLELAERVTEGRLYKRTTAEEDKVIRSRLEELVHSMDFIRPAATTR